MKRLILTILLCLWPVCGWGTTYTVCSSGCDETAIQDVFDNNDLAPSDTIEVHAGTYQETVTWGVNDSGDSSANVTLQAKSGETVIIDGQSTRANGIDLNSQDYIVIDGFTIQDHTAYGIDGLLAGNVTVQNCTVSGSTTAEIAFRRQSNINVLSNTVTATAVGILIDGSTSVDVCNNTITGGSSYCIDVNTNSTVPTGYIRNNTITQNNNADVIAVHTVVAASDSLYVQNNTVTGTGNQDGIDLNNSDNVICRKNEVYDWGGNGIKAGGTSTTGNEICQNIVYGCTGYGIGNNGAVDTIYYNNVVYDCDPNYNLSTSSANIIAKNNISLTAKQSAQSYDVIVPGDDGGAIDYNCWYRASGDILQVNGGSAYNASEIADYRTDTSYGDNSIVIDPQFIDSTDFKLKANSPCINVGADLSGTVDDDYRNRSRPKNKYYDIGAYEFTKGTLGGGTLSAP